MFLLSEMIIAPYWWQTAAARLIAWQQWASWEEAGVLGIFKEGCDWVKNYSEISAQ